STVGVAKDLPAVAGLLMEKELRFLGGALKNPDRPLVAALGGAKVSDKIGVLEHLLDRVDAFLVGGGMANTFLKAQGQEVGRSLVEEERLAFARNLLKRAREKGVHVLLPVDAVVAERKDGQGSSRVVPAGQVPPGWYIMDVGPKTLESFRKELAGAKTVIWNGPLGVFEMAPFRKGTVEFAQVLAGLKAVTIIGGGSTAEAVEELGLAEKMTHVSTGGGATLEFLEGDTLPGVAALRDKEAA
ncbi:MAG: phosphoglycerate kinase, partial [Chloroflexota bacterium]